MNARITPAARLTAPYRRSRFPAAQQLDGADPASRVGSVCAILGLAGRAAHLEAVRQPAKVRLPPDTAGHSPSSATRFVPENDEMPKIEISQQTYDRAKSFKQVVEAVIEEEMDLDTCLETILIQGMNLMLAELLAPLEPATLLESINQLASKHPTEVYGYVTDTMKRGANIRQRQEFKRKLGFHPPGESPA